MNDPWDVKSVRQSTQYISCLKLNGVPLLPPVLSKECRKEMQYYKLLAKEVERRINLLKRYVTDSETESTEDKTDAPELPPDFEQLYEDKTDTPELEKEEIETNFDVNLEKITAYTNLRDKPPLNDISYSPDLCKSISNLTKADANHRLSCQSPKFLFDVSLNIIESGKDILEKVNSCQTLSPQPTDPPERDYNNTPKKNTPNKNKKELLTDVETFCYKNKRAQNDGTKNMLTLNFNQSDPFPDMGLEDGPASLGAKSFTGSLNNIHRESLKVSCKLIRQRSYTVLNPSPQLLAHLKVQSMNTGVDVTSISMSESQSNLGITKKRRSWDLESAKVKWSSMALELKSKTAVNNANKNQIFRNVVNKNRVVSPPRSRSVMQDRSRRGSLPNKSLPKTEPIQKAKKSLSPLRNSPSNRTIVKEPISISTVQNSPQSPKQKAVTLPAPNKPIEQKLFSDSEDPAARVRELYEKIQNQQLIQMANLVEKQKKEQMLLQQVFEEQNSILYKQLKTICPTTSIEPKEAWGDKLSTETPDRGPVSLSQLMSLKSEKHADRTPPLTSMLTETHDQINKCDMILRKSRDMTSSLRKQQTRRSPSDRSGVAHSPRSPPDGSRTRTHSPNLRHTSISRKLNYDTSASSDKEFEPILTDRTNDTLAGLNVSFPTDSEVSSGSVGGPRNELTMIHCPAAVAPRSSTDSAIRSLEDTIHNSINSTPTRKYQPKSMNGPPTPPQRAAADIIVAHAKGYLVRRLMRTERVQATVQTIKDALLCALQLHQDRAGIRGADVDLHRRLIQQITAACYSLHDTFVASAPAERCALIAADRERRRQKPPPVRHVRQKSDIMSQSHSGAFTTRTPRAPAALMTQSNHETFSGEKGPGRYMSSPRRRPWR